MTQAVLVSKMGLSVGSSRVCLISSNGGPLMFLFLPLMERRARAALSKLLKREGSAG